MMGGKKNKTGSSNIGRRTGINVLQGKSIRRQEDGIDVFEDYWTDSDSVRSDQTTLSNYSVKNRNQRISENVSNQESAAVSPTKFLRPSLKKTVEQRVGDYGGDSAPRVSKRKSLTFSEDVENATFARSKMTQTSHLLDVTENTPSNNAKHLKGMRVNADSLSDGEKSSPVRKSPRKMSNSFAQNEMEELPLSKDDGITEGVHDNKSGKKAEHNKNTRIDTAEASTSKNQTFTRMSYLTEIRRNEYSSSDSEENVPVRRSPRKISNTLPHNSTRDLPSSTNDGNVALSHETAPGKKTKGKSNPRVSEAEGLPTQNRTYIQTSSLKETRLTKIDSSRNERNSTVGRPSRSLSNTFAQNNMEDLPSSTDPAELALSNKIASGKKTKNNSKSKVAGEKCSPSKKRTHSQKSPLKETVSKKIDLVHSERNSLMERSPKVLTHNLSLISKEKENERNSTVGRSPQHATRSSDVQNYKERNLNSSEIAVSHQRENERRDDMRKSSLGKSPVAVKRKLQASKSLENSLSKSPCIQNRRDEVNKRNSLGKRSSLHKANSSEMLNQDECVTSRSDKSINRSKILVSSSKQKEQISSVEKSHRISDHNMRRISNSTDSHVAADNSVHSARRKIDFSKKQKIISQKKGPDSHNLRRSSRQRFPRLASWRNQRPKFANTSTGEIKFLGIDEGRPEDDYAYRKLMKRDERKVQKPKASIRKRKNIRKTTVVNAINGKKIKLNLHRPFSTYEWIKPDNDEKAGYMLSKVFASQFLSFGFLDIKAHSKKDKQYSPSDNVYFFVVKGVVDAMIGETFHTLQCGDSLIVPLGNVYSISNNTSSSALLNFCSFKIPFFKFQEKMADYYNMY